MHFLFRQTSIERRVVIFVVLFFIIIASGAMGYHWIEDWTWLDAFYMSAITVTTVGFGEIFPLSSTGRAFTIVLVLLGVGAFTYTFSSIGNYLIAGQLQGYLAKRRMKKETAKLHDHYIVCGFGRVGAEVAKEFHREGQTMVVIDQNENRVVKAQEMVMCLAIQGDAGDDDVLYEAGVERAKGLVAAADTDTTNVMITLSARAINPNLFIVARSSFESNRSKLVRAGADRVISPTIIGGRSMAQMVLRPKVVEFLDVVTRDESMELWIEDLTVMPGSELDGHTVGKFNVREKTGVTILTLRRHDGHTVISPRSDTTLHAGDMLVAFGTREQLSRFNELLQNKAEG